MCGTAAAASSRSTVRRTSSDPARARAAIWVTVPSMSAVSVLVMDWTAIGAPPPTMIAPSPVPTRTPMQARRGRGPASSEMSGSGEIGDLEAKVMRGDLSSFGNGARRALPRQEQAERRQLVRKNLNLVKLSPVQAAAQVLQRPATSMTWARGENFAWRARSARTSAHGRGSRLDDLAAHIANQETRSAPARCDRDRRRDRRCARPTYG